MTPRDPTALILMYFVVPLWIMAGVADYLCHRATRISTTSGAKESLIHLLMFLEVGPPLLAAIFLDVNASVIAFMVAMFLLHEATAYWDVSYAAARRRVTPFEQNVHSFLEIVPLLGLTLVVARHWPQFLSLFGAGSELADFALRLKTIPLPAPYTAAVLCAAGVLGALYLEELARCLRARDRAVHHISRRMGA
jgi:hypothetical protein